MIEYPTGHEPGLWDPVPEENDSAERQAHRPLAPPAYRDLHESFPGEEEGGGQDRKEAHRGEPAAPLFRVGNSRDFFWNRHYLREWEQRFATLARTSNHFKGVTPLPVTTLSTATYIPSPLGRSPTFNSPMAAPCA